jgi:hypothetical protein
MLSRHSTGSPPGAAEVSAEWFADPPLRYRPSATVTVGDGRGDEVPDALQQAPSWSG